MRLLDQISIYVALHLYVIHVLACHLYVLCYYLDHLMCSPFIFFIQWKYSRYTFFLLFLPLSLCFTWYQSSGKHTFYPNGAISFSILFLHHEFYLINRLPTPILSNRSPYFLLYNFNPDYSILRVFGCSCFPFLRPYNKHKLEFRSTECIFIGFSSNHKGYLCMDYTTGRIYVSRHVVFYELNFPLTSKSIQSSTTQSNYPDNSLFSLVSPPYSHLTAHSSFPIPSTIPPLVDNTLPSLSLSTPHPNSFSIFK